MSDPSTHRDLDWLLEGFTDRLPGALSALVVSSDGLALTRSRHVPEAVADQLAAATSGLISLTRGASRCFDAGAVRQVIIELDGGFLFVTSVSDGSSLAVFAEPDCDIGLVGYEMSLLVTRIGTVLTPAARGPVPAA